MDDQIVWDRQKGEFRILGQRHGVIDIQALCDHLDSLVGPIVAEVIMDNHEVRLGKEDAAKIRRENPEATIQEIIDKIIESELLSGVGVPKITMPEGAMSEGTILLEISNPYVKGARGAAKVFLTSYWSGVMSVILDSQFEASEVTYDERDNLLRARLVRRSRK